jgi:hypothetical protein
MQITQILAIVFLAAPAAAQLPFNETFEAGSNVGAWTLGVPMSNPSSGGNPGAYISGTVDTFAPQPRTSAVGNVFTGNWRTQGVRSVGIDLRTISVQFNFDRELTLMLGNDNGTPGNTSDDCVVYFLGTRRVPQIAEGWKKFDFYVAADSTTLPTGWLHLGPCSDPNAAWNSVITNVSYVKYFYGDPTFFFIFDMWTVGLDNARIAAELPATNFCVAKTNSQGCKAAATMSGIPSASNPAPFLIGATSVLNQVNGLMFYGLGPNNAPFLGGTLCAAPPLIRTAMQQSGGSVVGSDCSGAYSMDFNAHIQSGFDPNLVAGTAVFTQYWYRDPAGSMGAGLSDGAQFTIQL